MNIIAQIFLPLLIGEKRTIDLQLELTELEAFIHPRSLPMPTVDYESRCRLEDFRSINLDCYLPGLSANGNALLSEVFSSLVTENQYSTKYSMQGLHGFTASKTSMHNNPKRASQPSMAKMGALIDDLEKLKGKVGPEIIQACLQHSELRLKSGIRLLTDNWHRRFYWSNSGGSHHMAVLCYQLERQGREWIADVDVTEQVLNLDGLESIDSRLSIFVGVANPKIRYAKYLFKRSENHVITNNSFPKLGISLILSPSLSGLLKHYHFIVVDHTMPYSSISLSRCHRAVELGQLVTFRDFLQSWTESLYQQ